MHLAYVFSDKFKSVLKFGLFNSVIYFYKKCLERVNNDTWVNSKVVRFKKRRSNVYEKFF
jgi:hypothetical protein